MDKTQLVVNWSHCPLMIILTYDLVISILICYADIPVNKLKWPRLLRIEYTVTTETENSKSNYHQDKASLIKKGRNIPERQSNS